MNKPVFGACFKILMTNPTLGIHQRKKQTRA